MIEERRKTDRYLSVTDVTITCALGTFTVELFDVNSTGIGFSWINGNPCLEDGIRVECHEPLRNLHLSGKIIGNLSDSAYQPNVRSVGLAVDDHCLKSVEQLMQSCASRPAPPGDSSIGLQRAWNSLKAEEKELLLLSEYFEKLRGRGGDEEKIASNLIKDPNCSGYRLFNFLTILLRQLTTKTAIETHLETLQKAFYTYQQFTVLDAERDRLISWA